MTAKIDVVNGPSKFDLSVSLFKWQPEHFAVEFVAKDGIVYEATIGSCEAEDGSGESWNLEGFAWRKGGHLHFPFKAYFRTDTRKGFLKY